MEKIREGYILTEQECVEKGGHKYDLGSWALSSHLTRTCKYCGHCQEGHNPSTVWEDV